MIHHSKHSVTPTELSRRRFLRGVGAAFAVPAFASLLSDRAIAGAASTVAGAGASAAGQLGVTATGAPLRTAFIYFPNGAIQDPWWPTGGGKDFTLSPTLKSLENVKDQIQILGGLDQVNATAGQDGGGDHARAGGTFLTGVRVKKTAGADIHAGISIDQVIAQKVGHLTRFPSLELTCDATRKSGNCDSGYSCAYQHNMSWRSPTTPNAPEANPRLVFERLFGAGPAGQRGQAYQQRLGEQRSILDFVMDDADSMNRKLDTHDRHKLDEYLTGVREIEKRIEASDRFGLPADPSMPTPPGIPASFRDHVQIMFDMMLLAFQTDSTRVASLLLAGDGSNRAFPEIKIPEGHHFLTHHQRKPDLMAKVAEIDKWYVQQLAAFLEKLDKTQDVDGKSLLHNSMIIYGSGIADGNRHSHTSLPIVLAGRGGGTLDAGRFVTNKSAPMCNLYLSLADRMGYKDLQRFGDSTGRLATV